MKFLGVLLVILGIGGVISSFFSWFSGLIVGIIFIALGSICISSANKTREREAQEFRAREEERLRKEREYQEEKKRRNLAIMEERKRLAAQQTAKEEAESKELWIAKRIQALMDQGMLPSDAKIKAETEYIIAQSEKK